MGAGAAVKKAKAGEPPPPPQGGAAGSSEFSNESDFVLELAKLTLNNAQRTRQLEGLLQVAFVLPNEHRLVKELAEVGAQHSKAQEEAADDEAKKKLAPPFVLKWKRVAEFCSQQQHDDQQLKEAVLVMQKHNANLSRLSLPSVVALVGVCTCKTIWVRKGRTPSSRLLLGLVPGHMSAASLVELGEAEGEAEVVPMEGVFQAVKLILTKGEKAEMAAGPPPPSAAERKVSNWVRKKEKARAV